MPGFTLITGNRLEVLAEMCSADLAAYPLPPMQGEVICVQSMGMMKWLTLRLAEANGVWANCRYIFPNNMSSMLLEGFFPGSGNERYFDRASIPWQIMRVLKSVMNRPVFSQIAEYTGDDPSGVRMYQLCSAVSDVFDQYMTFRPEMINAWDRGGDADLWQAELWRLVTRELDSQSPPSLLERLKPMLRSEGFRPAGDLPRRLTLFGISYLPLYHINLLFAASSFTDIRMYMLNPSEAYWGDILGEKDKLKIISRFPIPPSDPEADLHLDSGNPLLASMGRPGRDFIRSIFSMDCDTEQNFYEPEGGTLLAMVQQDIFNMTDRSRTGEKLTPGQIADDTSIIINSCHSPMREIEVLRDYILDLFNSNDGLEPRDIIVMAPDIEIYSGCVEPVFSGSGTGKDIPFRIADRKPAASEPSIAAFLELLDLPGSRFTASRIISLLDCAEISGHFGFNLQERERIASWIRDTNARWGIDAEFRRKMNLPADEANTFSAGIKRLITGLLVSGDEPCLGVLPLESADPGDSLLMGRFITYIKTLEESCRNLMSEHTLHEWYDILMFMISSLFSTVEGVPGAMMPVTDAVSLLRQAGISSGFSDSVGIAPVKEFIESRMASPGSVRDFISGAVTFCEMLPMRSIPCRVICLLGMDAKSFPGRSASRGFDLMAAKPARGDRSVRDEGRYLFLETIISARDRLYISYTGQNIINNTTNDPSPVVSELLDYIASFGSAAEADEIRSAMITLQKLNRYSSGYFLPESGLYSFSPVNMKEAEAAIKNPSASPLFFSGPLPAAGGEYRLTTADLAWFMRSPARALCVSRLGISLEIKETAPLDDEPFEIDRRTGYSLNGELLQVMAGGGDTQPLFDKMKAAGMLPHGAAGRAAFDKSAGGVKRFIEMIPGAFARPENFAGCEVTCRGVHLRIKPCTLYDGEPVFAAPFGLRSLDLLRSWIEHLVLCACGKKIRTRIFYGEESRGNYSVKQAVFDYAADAQSLLEKLADLYVEGMNGPVELFPESSRTFVEAFNSPGKDEPLAKGMKAARERFYNFRYPENADPYILKVFGSGYSPGRKFRDTALAVYGPVYENMAGEVQGDE